MASNSNKNNRKGMKLVTEMLAGKASELRPQLDFTVEAGFSYPIVEEVLGLTGREAIPVLECLVEKGILKKEFFDRMLYCPQCQSVLLRPTTNCPKCTSGHIIRGRVFEHAPCKYAGLEEEFVLKGAYICPKCKLPLQTVGADYESLGLLYKCHDCKEIFQTPVIKWRCLQCQSVTPADRVTEVNLYSYRLDEVKRSWLEFELKPKGQLIEFLKQRGYEVVENAVAKGRSGADHKIDILATRDDGIIGYTIAIGVKVAVDKIELSEIFDFDEKAYDSGIHDKILIVLPDLGKEAEAFANLQRIKVIEVRDLESVLSRVLAKPSEEIKREPFEFRSKAQLIEYLTRLGYQVEENAALRGKSGATHNVDLLASRDDGLVIHRIAIGIEEPEKPVELERVFDFDDKAYDIGIMDKIFIAIPGLTREARQFAQRQKIRVFEAKDLQPVR